MSFHNHTFSSYSICCITLKRVTSLQYPAPRYGAKETRLFVHRC